MLRTYARLRPLVLAALLMIAVPMLAGCSSQQTEPPPASSTQTAPAPAPAPEEGHDSLLGATAHFVWTVIALPFRIVGDVIGEVV